MPAGSIQKVQIRSNCLILYDLYEYYSSTSAKFRKAQIQTLLDNQQTAYSGSFSPGAMKRIARSIDLMCQSVLPVRMWCPVSKKQIRHRLSFITLTISQGENITAKTAYDKAFKHFLQWLRRTCKVTTYVWKAEVQKRGQIHYHITTPSYIHYQSIRDKWNNLQRKNGWTNEYFNKHRHYDPNSTDIHQVRKIHDLSGYLKKEFCKAMQNPAGEGKVWDCSENLKQYKYYTIEESDAVHWAISDLIESGQIDVIPTDYCMIVKMNQQSVTSIMNVDQINKYDKFLHQIRNHRK